MKTLCSEQLPGHYIGAQLVTLEGPPKAGKTETMFELAQIINHLGCKAEVFLMAAHMPQCTTEITHDGYDPYSQAIRALAALSKLYRGKILNYLEHDTIVIVDNWVDYIMNHCGLSNRQIHDINYDLIVHTNKTYAKYYLPDSAIKNPDYDMKKLIDRYQYLPIYTDHLSDNLRPIKTCLTYNNEWCAAVDWLGGVIPGNTKRSARENAKIIAANLAVRGVLKNVSYSYNRITGRCAFWSTRASILL